MAVYLPLDLIFLPPPPPPPWRPPPSPMPTPTHNSSTSPEGVIAGVSIVVVGIVLFMLCCMCRLSQGHNHSRASAGSDAAAAAAAVAARPQAPPVPEPLDNDERQLRSAREREDGRPQRAIPAAGLPLFTYNRSVKHDVGTGSGEEEATCSVCLGAFQICEMVRLLPVCLHLYHVECIDPWLDAHSTCPLCRSGTGPMMDGGPLPPA